MRHTDGRDNLCSWLLNTGGLSAWRRHRPTRRKTVMTVNDTWLRARTRSQIVTARQSCVLFAHDELTSVFAHDSYRAWKSARWSLWVECY